MIISALAVKVLTENHEAGEYALKRKVIKLGGGYAVTIPTWLAEAKNIRAGDIVTLKFVSYPGLVIERRATIPYRRAND